MILEITLGMPLEEFIIYNETAIRIGVFSSLLLIIGIWELIAPRRVAKISKLLRWFNNLTLVLLNNLILRFLFPIAATGMALFAENNGWGFFNYYEFNPLLEIIISIIFLDLIIYLQHVLVHAVPALWRLHRVHHADLDYDVTTGSRFHPIEIIISMLIKLATIIVLGPAVIAVIIFEVLLNAMAMFNHGNIGLPRIIDNFLRLFIVTPDMHRIHHSIEDDETNSNFGFNLSCWDHLFGTYRDQARKSQVNMDIGIRGFNTTQQTTWLQGLLTMPFTGKVTDYTINRRTWNVKNTPED